MCIINEDVLWFPNRNQRVTTTVEPIHNEALRRTLVLFYYTNNIVYLTYLHAVFDIELKGSGWAYNAL